MASFWYGNYCIPAWKGENTLGKERNVRWQVPITHGPIKQPSLPVWPCTVMPAAHREHTAAQLGPLHSQRVLCSTTEFGNKAEQGSASSWKSSYVQKAGCSHANKCVTKQGTEQNCGLQHKLIQNIIFKNNRSHHTPWSLNIRLDQSLSYRICAFRPKKNPTTRKQNSSKVTYKTNLYKL